MAITRQQLSRIMPNIPPSKLASNLPHINAAMSEFSISTSNLRVSAFLAQIAHESAELRYMEEIASGIAYEGRADLGNIKPGDGRRYKGRGPIQLTGRSNYQIYGAALGLDLIGNPTLASTPAIGFRIAGLYWNKHGLNTLADAGNFREITHRINGGYNGEEDREKYYHRALEVLANPNV